MTEPMLLNITQHGFIKQVIRVYIAVGVDILKFTGEAKIDSLLFINATHEKLKRSTFI